MSATAIGYRTWSARRDRDGHRDYTLEVLIQTTDKWDGPQTVMNASGLPAIGAPWSFGNDNDPWALCWPEISVTPVLQGEPNFLWIATLTFTTRPLNRCQDSSIENPLNEPQKISGSFTRFMKKAKKDRHGKLILSSSHEIIKGIEQDANRPSVTIEQNVASLGLPTIAQMVNTLNDSTLWGLDARKIMLADVSWDRKLYGTCSYYYTRRFTFEIRYEGFDLTDVEDVGHKRLRGQFDKEGKWIVDPTADPTNPDHFVNITDVAGNIVKEPQPLNNAGDINPNPIADPKYRPTIELLQESNFLILGIPTTL